MIRRHSAIAHAAYFDLLASLKDEAVADLRGTPTRVERQGKIYWYDSFRVGSEVRKTYIGEDSDEIRTRLARHAELAARRAEAQTSRARLIRILRAEGFLGVDASTGALLNAFAHAGVFRLGGDRRHAGLPILRRRTRSALRLRPDRANPGHRHRQL